jgi:hypothetical protein
MTADRTRQPVARDARRGHVIGMSRKDKEREERLAAALRENLRKRKAQARTLAEPSTKGEVQR